MAKTKKVKKNRKEAIMRFLKKNVTPTWAKRFSYQVFAFITSVAMIFGVVNYAFNKTYDERNLRFVDGFTITAHTGAYDTPDNTMEAFQVALEHKAEIIEIDIRQRPNGTIVMAHDIINTNNDGVAVAEVFKILQNEDVKLNLDIKETRVLKNLYDLIMEYQVADKVFFTGIEAFETDKVKENCPGIEYYLNCKPSRFSIFTESYQKKILDLMEKTGAVGINCKHIYASRTLSNLLHKNGYKLSIWTVDRKSHLKRALINTPDNITTHHPDQLEETIKNWGK